MCRALEVSRAGYYAWRGRKPSAREKESERLVGQIKVAQVKSRGIYGSPKIHRKLRRDGERVSRKRVARLIKEQGIAVRRVKKSRRTTDSRHSLPVADNVLARQFRAEHPDEVWTSDITYVWTQEGWLYLVVFLDLYSRLVVGWAVSESLETEFVERAFLQGQARRGRAVSPLVHSDRGSQYASAAFRKRVPAWGCTQSMSRKGNCWDNAVTESFFGNLKSEMVHHERFATKRAAAAQLFDYIEVFYNRMRIHSASDYYAPAEYEARDLRAVERGGVRLADSIISVSTKRGEIQLTHDSTIVILSKSATIPSTPFVSSTSRSTCGPAVSLTPLLLTV
jgi:transposase InsO family protein